jgi:predicted tellurium resistance membrane protein TerC
MTALHSKDAMDFFAPLIDPANLPSILSLTLLEIVLGIDNVIFITILAGRLPKAQQKIARQIGLGAALASRIGLLAGISWIITLEAKLFYVMGHGISGKDLILIVGGLFLLGKATHEIYESVEHPGEEKEQTIGKASASFTSFLVQVMLLDMIFSLDSVITAVGMVNDPSKLSIMVTAVVLAVIVMIIFANPVGDFVQRHASIKVLALSFLVLIGVLLIAEGCGEHLDKRYVYFAMVFALIIEFLNMRLRKRKDPVDQLNT